MSLPREVRLCSLIGAAAARAAPRCAVAASPAYADERVFSQSSFKARPAQDVAGALFTFLAVAFGRDCVAPWLGAGTRSEDEAFEARAMWLRRRADGDAGVARVAAALDELTDRVRAQGGGGGGGGGGSGACDIARAALTVQ